MVMALALVEASQEVFLASKSLAICALSSGSVLPKWWGNTEELLRHSIFAKKLPKWSKELGTGRVLEGRLGPTGRGAGGGQR